MPLQIGDKLQSPTGRQLWRFSATAFVVGGGTSAWSAGRVRDESAAGPVAHRCSGGAAACWILRAAEPAVNAVCSTVQVAAAQVAGTRRPRGSREGIPVGGGSGSCRCTGGTGQHREPDTPATRLLTDYSSEPAPNRRLRWAGRKGAGRHALCAPWRPGPGGVFGVWGSRS